MRHPDPKNSADDHRSLNSDSVDSPGPERELSAGVESRKRTAWWRRPANVIALLGLLFGSNVVGRHGCAATSDDDAQVEPSPLSASGEGRFHARYSFKHAPFVHPKIVGDLVGNLADAGDQVVAINLLDAEGSNRYFGKTFVTPQTDPLVPSWPWVHALDGEPRAVYPPGSFRGQELYAYRYVGSTPNGLDVLHYLYSGGGSGVFNSLVFVRIEADQGVDYTSPTGIDHVRNPVGPEFRERELIRIVGKISLGDRWRGTVEVVGSDVVARGRHVYERCEVGGVSIIEAVELDYFMDLDCKDGAPDDPPAAQVYKVPA